MRSRESPDGPLLVPPRRRPIGKLTTGAAAHAELAVDVTLHYGQPARPRTLKAGTRVTIVSSDQHLTRIRYPGLPEHAEPAIVNTDDIRHAP